MHATPLGETQKAVLDMLRHGTNLDVFHFGGHGRADPADIGNSEILLKGRRVRGGFIDTSVTSTLVAQNAKLGTGEGQGPLVVLNACQVGRLGRQMSSLGGFAEAFINGGAGAFVSSLWSVGDAPALTFVETLYRELLNGSTIAAASAAARQASR